MSKAMKTIDLEPIEKEVVSPRRFVDLYKEEADSIESVTIIPARLGSKGFGTLLVKWRKPVYGLPSAKRPKAKTRRGFRFTKR